MTNFRYKVYYVFLNFGISHDFVVYFGYIGYFFNVIGIPLHPLADPVNSSKVLMATIHASLNFYLFINYTSTEDIVGYLYNVSQ